MCQLTGSSRLTCRPVAELCRPGRVLRQPHCSIVARRGPSTSFPDRMDQIDCRIQDPTGDQEQNGPYQIVDLPPEFGRCLLHRLRSPEEGRLQEQDDRDRRNKDGDQFVHIVSLRLMKNDVSLPFSTSKETIAHMASLTWPTAAAC